MLGKKFSSQVFEARGLNTEASQQLANELSSCVCQKLTEVLNAKFAEIIAGLIAEGHQLELYDRADGQTFSKVNYRDDSEDERGYTCKLMVDLNISVCSGYAHLVSEEEMEKE